MAKEYARRLCGAFEPHWSHINEKRGTVCPGYRTQLCDAQGHREFLTRHKEN